jgi:2-phospho-L-lactate guanylyltransferase
MDLWAIIAVKPFALGKSRLAAMLGDDERAALNRWLFDRVFGAALSEIGAGRIAVVSSDPLVHAQVRWQRAHMVQERARGGQNQALKQGSDYAVRRGARAILVLPSDLPEISGEDIAALKSALGPPPSCVLAPDLSGEGTNALALTPPEPELFHFGPKSFSAHMQAARRRGFALHIVRRPGLAEDIDTPESYRQFVERHGNSGVDSTDRMTHANE